MNLGGSGMFTFEADLIDGLQMKTNQTALQTLNLKSTFMYVFLEWKYIFIFHIIAVNMSSQTNAAFASQNLKFARQMSDHWCRLVYRTCRVSP